MKRTDGILIFAILGLSFASLFTLSAAEGIQTKEMMKKNLVKPKGQYEDRQNQGSRDQPPCTPVSLTQDLAKLKNRMADLKESMELPKGKIDEQKQLLQDAEGAIRVAYIKK